MVITDYFLYLYRLHTEQEKVNWNWDHVHVAVDNLVETLKAYKELVPFERIYCIGRGGLFLTRILSGVLDINHIEYIPYSRTMKYVQDIAKIPAIFVDDILDSGNTFSYIYDSCLAQDINMRKMVFAFMVARERTFAKFMQNPTVTSNIAVGQVIDYNNYIVFPWEAYDHD